MTESDFATIEKSLGITVPTPYRRLMLAYPFRDDRPSEAFIPDDAQYLCGLNRQIREDAVFSELWRPEYFAIGTTWWGGDAHILDTSLADSPVLKLSPDDQAVTTIGANLEAWVAKLRRWYVDFDADCVAREYKELSSAISDAGYFITAPEPMDGWHRVCVSSKRGGGNSFWVAVVKGNWFAGAWGGNIYRIAENVADFCVAWLSVAPVGTRADFSVEIQTRFRLESISDSQFDSIVGAN